MTAVSWKLSRMEAVECPQFGFTKIIVSDAERAFGFYRDVFGLEEVARVQRGEGDEQIDEIVAKPPNMPHIPSVVLKCYVNRTPPAPGELQLGFKVPSVDDVLQRALSHGGAIVKHAVDRPEYGVRVAFLTDNDGHMIEIVQPI